MEFAFDAGGIIRMGSGLLWLALGVAVLWMQPGHRLGRVLGWVLAAFGARLVGINVAGAAQDLDAFVIPFALLVVADVAGTILAFLLVVRLAKGFDAPRKLEVFVATVAVVASAAVYSALSYGSYGAGLPPRFAPQIRSVYEASAFLSYSFLALVGVATIVIAIRLRRNDFTDIPRRNAILLAVGLTIWFAYSFGLTLVSRGSNWTLPLQTALPVLWWFAAMWGQSARAARGILLGFLSLALVGTLVNAFAPSAADTLGSVGIVRTVGVVLAATGLFGGDWLQFRRRPWFARRGTLAATSLAALFVVAQIAENFLDAEYGILMGGIVAGALLFAANPLQRAFERVTGEPPAAAAPAVGTPLAADQRARNAYRQALRVALHDGAMTREEERHLAGLADHLGIGYGDAVALREEVEAELGRGSLHQGRGERA